MGIKTIMQARKVLMVVNGKGKAEIVKKAFFGPVTPGSARQHPADAPRLHPGRRRGSPEPDLMAGGFPL